MNRWSLRTLKWVRNIIIMVGIVGGLIIWLNIPSMILNNSLIHVGNGKFGSKIGMLSILILPLLCLIFSTDQSEIHTDDEAERARLETEMRKATVNIQICHAIVETIIVLGVMSAGMLFC